MMHKEVQNLIDVFEAQRNTDDAIQMEKYMRHKFKFLGIRSPDRKRLAKDFNKRVKWDEEADIEAIIMYLWELPEREYQYVAVDYLVKNKQSLTAEHVDLLEYLITRKSWWDTVDLLASHLVGTVFAKYPTLIQERGEVWLHSGNIWLQRSILLFQLKYKEETDKALLFSLIQYTSPIDEFFIQKAIGWGLREYSKTNPDAVVNFIENNGLSNLARREGLKHVT